MMTKKEWRELTSDERDEYYAGACAILIFYACGGLLLWGLCAVMKAVWKK